MRLEHSKNAGAVILRDEPFDMLGHDRVELPFIWIPDDYVGPRPGYPWFEAGRMTLSPEQLAAWPPCRLTPWGAEARSSNDAASVQQGAGEATEGPQPPGLASADRPGPAPADAGNAVNAAAAARLAGYTYPNTGAAMKAWNALSNPRATLAALDAVSGSNPVVRSLAQDRGNAAQRTADATSPPDKATSFANQATYAYDGNDPLNAVDPLGPCDDPQSCGGGITSRIPGSYQVAQAQLAIPLIVGGAQVLSDLTTILGGGAIILNAKPPPSPQPISNPPQPAPPIPGAWVNSPTYSGGGTIYYPPGQNPPDSGESIRVMPPGSSSVPGLENGYWVQTNKTGQPINPATGQTGTRGQTHVPLPPSTPTPDQ